MAVAPTLSVDMATDGPATLIEDTIGFFFNPIPDNTNVLSKK